MEQEFEYEFSPEILLEAAALYCCNYRRKDIYQIFEGWYGENVAEAFWQVEGVDAWNNEGTIWDKLVGFFQNWVDEMSVKFPLFINGINVTGFMQDSNMCLAACAATDELEASSVAERLLEEFEIETDKDYFNEIIIHYCLLAKEWDAVKADILEKYNWVDWSCSIDKG